MSSNVKQSYSKIRVQPRMLIGPPVPVHQVSQYKNLKYDGLPGKISLNSLPSPGIRGPDVLRPYSTEKGCSTGSVIYFIVAIILLLVIISTTKSGNTTVNLNMIVYLPYGNRTIGISNNGQLYSFE